MKGKTCVITGANAGIGFETAKALATKGARIVMICRNAAKAEAARDQLQKESGNTDIEFYIADMGVQDQIKAASQQIKNKYDNIDVLINNAGTWVAEQTFTPDEVEMVFAVNHLAYVLLTFELYPLLQAGEEGRIINLSSDSHFNAKLDLDNLYLNGKYNGLRSYALSKLGNVMFTYELDRRKDAPHISVNAVQPGLVKTDIGLKHTHWWQGLIWKIRRSGGVAPDKGAETSVYLATSEEVKGMSGKYWDKCAPKPSSKISYDQAAAARLWEVSLDLLGIEDFFAVQG